MSRQPRPAKPAVKPPFDDYRRRAVYVRQNGHLGDFTARQNKRIRHKRGRDQRRAETATGHG
jgi:hypothetical protein